MIEVGRRAKRHPDTAGDPLDGLVNLFDLGIVLSVGFLLAALTAIGATGALTDGQGGSGAGSPSDAISVPPDSEVRQVPTDGATVIGNGQRVGEVYRLQDGTLVYVVPSESPSPSASPTVRPSGTAPTSGATPR